MAPQKQAKPSAPQSAETDGDALDAERAKEIRKLLVGKEPNAKVAEAIARTPSVHALALVVEQKSAVEALSRRFSEVSLSPGGLAKLRRLRVCCDSAIDGRSSCPQRERDDESGRRLKTARCCRLLLCSFFLLLSGARRAPEPRRHQAARQASS